MDERHDPCFVGRRIDPEVEPFMTLRLRLFLLFGALVALLFAGQVWLVRTLTRDLSEEVGEVAVSVGQSVVTAVGGGDLPVIDLPTPAGERRIKVIHRARRPDVRQGEGYQFRVLEGTSGATVESEDVSSESGHQLTSLVVRLNDQGEGRTLVLEEDGERREIPIPERGVGSELSRFTRRLLFGTLSLLGLGLIAAAVVAHRVSRPLVELSAAARRVGAGELGTEATVPSDPEVAATVLAFNQMSSALKRLDEESRELRSREHLAEIGEVARGLAHSLRNPLNALGLTLEELAAVAAEPLRPKSGQDPVALASTARRQIQRIDRSLKSLLVLSADSSGSVASEILDLHDLVNDVVLEALQDFRGRVGFDVVAEAAEPVRLHGVPAELRAMVQALVANAGEASPESGRVTVRLGLDGERAVVEVRDQGYGLPAEVRSRLFSPHVSTKATGSGMGLFLCQRLATSRYGGALTLADRPEGGTLARLVLRDRVARETVVHA